MSNRLVAITTIDNPYDYFDDFTNWLMFDTEKGYYTCNKLARLSDDTFGLSSVEENRENERAIDRLIELDPLDIYIKVVKEVKNDENNEEKKELE